MDELFKEEVDGILDKMRLKVKKAEGALADYEKKKSAEIEELKREVEVFTELAKDVESRQPELVQA